MMYYIFVVFLIIFNIFCVYAFFIEPHALETTTHSLPLDTPASPLQGITIVHISDLHVNHIGNYESRIIKTINALKPDIIAVTGDLISYNQSFAAPVQLINALHSRLGIFVVLGNCDYSNIENYFTTIKKTPWQSNVRLLRNEIIDIIIEDERIRVCGIDDPINGDPDLSLLAQWDTTSKKGMDILLTHAYTTALRPFAQRFDLTLAGHTHGGQFNLIPQAIIKKWRSMADSATYGFFDGFQQDGNGYVNVNRGLGVSYLPMRFMARPEISVIQIT